jgi:predicted  nucleic acid-binding Zn-ribbon protein
MTDKIELEVTEEQAEKLVEQMQEELERMVNTLNSFRSNNLTDTEAYKQLEVEKEQLERDIDGVQEQIDEQEEDGLGELFG